ncbi:MAG: type II secretion system F family protein [Eubacterium sp.]|nr:type II secretion system F family protein [Eubacterium sp.]
MAVSILTAGLLVWLRHKKMIRNTLFWCFMLVNAAGAVFAAAELATGGRQAVTVVPSEELRASGYVPMEVRTDSGGQYEIEIEPPEAVYSPEEAGKLLREAGRWLDKTILGENQTLSHVSRNLELPALVKDGPVTVEWYTDKPEILGSDGVIQTDVPEEGASVTLYAELGLQDQKENWQRTVTVFPSEEPDSIREAILNESRKLNQEAEENTYRLPSEAAGRQLRWFRADRGPESRLSLLALIGGLVSVIAMRERRERSARSRQEQMLQDYPELLSKMQLYLGAGLSMRTIFFRISREYQARRASGAPARHAYEEVSRTAVRMENGATELEAYDEFGSRCQLPCYRGLALLLSQNLQKGGAGILPQMEREVQDALEAARRRARAEGEKATVRLLLPMAMMLLVVMALILIPAFYAL